MKKLNMYAQALNPVKSRMSDRSENPPLEIVRLSPRWQGGLVQLLQALRQNGEAKYFSPHPADEETIAQLARYSGRDLYYLLVEGENVLGYGLLRGWDEGYEIPSLGIAIHPSARGFGLGRSLITFLHVLAVRNGAAKVRLRVLKTNDKAIRLYESIGYVFMEDTNQCEYMVGIFQVGKEAER